MVSKLPNECLQQIFRSIKDIDTLYSIVQVNHTWCENGIIYLWKNPFRNDVKSKNGIKIIPILLSFLKKDDRTLFDYPCLITHLNFDNLFRTVAKFSKLKNDLFKHYLNLIEQDKLLSSIFHNIKYSKWSEFGQIWVINLLILVYMAKRKVSIRWFKLDNKYTYFENLVIGVEEDGIDFFYLDNERIVNSELQHNVTSKVEDIFTVFLKFEKSKNFFKNLEYLECGQLSYKNPILKSLSQICRQLKSIQLEEDFRSIYIYMPFVSMIKYQRQLENLRIVGIKNNSGMWFYEKNISEIFSSLESVSHSLKRFEASGIVMTTDETFQFLSNCKNLEILRLEDSTISHENFKWIAKAELPRLHSLELTSNCDGANNNIRRINPFQEILKNKIISSNLKKLHLRNKLLANYDLLDSIAENCRNIIDFSTQLTANSDISILLRILKNNSNLKKLYLNVYLDTHIVDINTEIIIDLAKSLPKRINTVQLELLINNVYDCKIFLENCAADLKYFYIVNLNDNDINEYMMDCIQQWSEEKGKKIAELSYAINDSFRIVVVWDGD